MSLTRSVGVLLSAAALCCLVISLGGCPKPAIPLPGGGSVTPGGEKTTLTTKGEDGKSVTVESEKQGGKEGKVTVTTGEGTTTAEVGKDKVSEKDIGVAFYPGATVDAGVSVNATGGKGGKASTVTMATSDPLDKVTSFYKDKYGKGNTVVEQGGTLMISIRSGEGAGKMIMVAPSEDKSGTKIIIHASAQM